LLGWGFQTRNEGDRGFTKESLGHVKGGSNHARMDRIQVENTKRRRGGGTSRKQKKKSSNEDDIPWKEKKRWENAGKVPAESEVNGAVK